VTHPSPTPAANENGSTALDSNPQFNVVQALRPAPQNSIEFSRNAKGEPAWSIKLYFTSGEGGEALDSIDQLDHDLVATFRPRWSLPSGSTEGV
jgi:hypothetical protein